MKKGMNKTRVRSITGVVLCFVVLSAMTMSCKQESIISDEIIDSSILMSQEVKLGEKIDNPFTINAARSAGADVEPNYYYFRCRTDDPEKLIWLRDTFIYLETIPMDYEIAEGGTFYDDPDIDEAAECPWFYFMKSVADKELIESQGFIVEVLEQMYVPEEALEIMNESTSVDASARVAAARTPRYPSGSIKIKDPTWGDIPVGNVEIWFSQGIFFNKADVDANGNFSSWMGYTDWFNGTVRHKIIFTNGQAILNGAGEWAQFIVPAFYQEPAILAKKSENRTIYLAAGTRQGTLGTIMNAVTDYCAYADKNGVTKPGQLRIWVADIGGGIALMLRQMTKRSLFQFADQTFSVDDVYDVVLQSMSYVGHTVSSVAALLPSEFLPDLIVSSSYKGGGATFYI